MDKLTRLENEFVDTLGYYIRMRQALRKRTTAHAVIRYQRAEKAADEALKRLLRAEGDNGGSPTLRIP